MGQKLLIAQPLMTDGQSPDGDPLLVIDAVGAGRGETVILTSDGRFVRERLPQEFAEVFPESVQKGGDKQADGDSVLQVDTYPATIYSIAAIQELDRKLKARDARVAEVEQDVAELKSLLQTMLQKTTKGGQ